MQIDTTNILRLQLVVVGIIGFWTMHLVLELNDASIDSFGTLYLLCALSIFTLGTMVMTGPVAMPRAAAMSAGLSLVATVLLALLSFQYAEARDVWSTPWNLLAHSKFVLVSLPFMLAWARTGGFAYADLFQQAWNFVVRVAVAWLFVGLFWLAIFLSDTLLSMVGITFLEHAWRHEPMAWAITGGAFGLGLAVVDELAEYVTPRLALQLLRMLLPPVTVVVGIFLIALPFRGFSNAFGTFSTGGTLLSMSALATLLITSTLDRDADHAARHRVLVWSARGLAIFAAIMSSLGAWAVWLRVAQYGLTPDRVAAALLAALALGYGILYGIAAMRGAGWMDHVRNVNRTMAVVGIVTAALWLSPLLDANRLSANSQLDRFQAGDATVEDLPLWEMREDWGLAGTTALEHLRQSDNPELVASLARLDAAESKWAFRNAQREEEPVDYAALRSVLPASDIPDGALEALSRSQRASVQSSCRRDPCAVVAVEEGWLLMYNWRRTVRAIEVQPEGATWGAQVFDVMTPDLSFVPLEALEGLGESTSRATTKPVPIEALQVGESTLLLIEPR